MKTFVLYLFRIVITVLPALMCYGGKNSETYNAILSSSPSGRFIVTANAKTNKTGIIDLKNQREIMPFPESSLKGFFLSKGDIKFIIWENDSVFYYTDEANEKIAICIYDVMNNVNKEINVLDEQTFKDISQLAFPNSISLGIEPFVICRNAIKEGTSTIYEENTILYKFYPLTGKKEKLFNMAELFSNDVSIEAVTVNSKGTDLLITVEEKDKEMISIYQVKINLLSAVLIEKSKDIDERNIFFTNDNSRFVYFKDLAKGKDNPKFEIILYDIKNKKSHLIDTYQNYKVPIYVVDVPIKKSLLVSYLDVTNFIEMKEPKGEPAEKILEIFETLVRGLISRFNIEQLSYEKITADTTMNR